MKHVALALLAGLALAGCATDYYEDDTDMGATGAPYGYERGGGLSSRVDVMKNTNALTPRWYPTPDEGLGAGRLPQP